MTHRETDLVSSEEQREDQAFDMKDWQAHIAINFETPSRRSLLVWGRVDAGLFVQTSLPSPNGAPQ
jgi:hypothetical protein